MMRGLAREPGAGCVTAACGAPCPAGLAEVASEACAGAGARRRCCPPEPYPDVFAWVDRGAASCFLDPRGPAAGLDASLLGSAWSNVRELTLLPGGKWQQRTAYAELDMATAATLASFLQAGLQAFPPTDGAGGGRRYALVFWDHGSGWAGYGIDGTCGPLAGYNDKGCDMLSLEEISQGEERSISTLPPPLVWASSSGHGREEKGRAIKPALS